MSRILNPLERNGPFHWISKKSMLVRAAKETKKNSKLITFTL